MPLQRRNRALSDAGCVHMLSPDYRVGNINASSVFFERGRSVHPDPLFALDNLAVRCCRSPIFVYAPPVHRAKAPPAAHVLIRHRRCMQQWWANMAKQLPLPRSSCTACNSSWCPLTQICLHWGRLASCCSTWLLHKGDTRSAAR